MDGRPQITKQTFIDAFTARSEDAGAMPTDELLKRLDITLNALKEQTNPENKGNRPPFVVVTNCLSGALIRLSQAYNDPEVSVKVRELVQIATDVSGI